MKMIEIDNKIEFSIKLQDFLLENTNCGLISLGIDRVCKKFVKELETLSLSEELQDFEH